VIHDGHDLVDLSVADLEGLGELPGPGLLRAGRDGAPVGRLERARVSGRVIKEDEAEDEGAPALARVSYAQAVLVILMVLAATAVATGYFY